MDFFSQAQVEHFLFISMDLINHVGSIYWYSLLFVILSNYSGEVDLSEQCVLSCLLQVEFNIYLLMIEIKYCFLAVSILAKDI